MHFTTALVSALAASTAAMSMPSSHVVHEKRDQPLRRWEKRDQVDRGTILPVRIGLQQSNVDNGVGDRLLEEVSHPESSKYGQHYTADEVIDIFAPAQEAVDTVKQWLTDAGVATHRVSQSANKQWIQFDANVAEVERLFKTKYHQYSHADNGKVSIGCDEYHLPDHVTKHVDYVTPGLKLLGTNLGETKRKRGLNAAGTRAFAGPIPIPGVPTIDNSSQAVLLSQCDSYITPPCIAAMYNISQATKANPTNKLGIFEEGDFYAPEDLALFFATFAQNIPITTEPVLEGIDGGFAPGVIATGESDLDFQISYPIIYPQNSILFQTDDIYYSTGILAPTNATTFFNTFLDAIDGSYCTFSAYGETGDAPTDPKYPDPNPGGYKGKNQCGVYKPTNVISVSYGLQEDDEPTNYQQRQCAEFMKLGMQGVTIVFASGDSGVAARSADDGNSDGCLGKGEVFNPDTPASCPYVTALGATYLPKGGDPKKDQEVAVTRFPSGGGFSNIYSRPSYQNNALNNYFSAHDPGYKSYSLSSATNNPTEAQTAGGLYNRAGRGYPDAAAIGDNVVIFLDGTPQLIGGTSAAAPVFASIINRINEERIAVGKKPVGFVNPTLYANPSAFHDITVGNNSGCNTAGFYAVKDWDPVTGLGTPNYPSLLKVFMGLP